MTARHDHEGDRLADARDHHHEHGDDHEHGLGWDDHDDGPDGRLADNPAWQQDNVMLRSVGVDIGSSGTQVAFSRLYLRRLSENLTSRYVVVRRELHFESAVTFTPFTDGMRIDAAALGAILDQAYADAGVTPGDIDTGAVILTGEALRRHNAEAIAGVASEHAGDLVCAAAGHHMEAMLAAYGSGAARASRQDHSRLLNVDIGGGTTKLTLVEDGTVTATAAFHVGGRLVAVGPSGTVVRLEPGGAYHARRAGAAVALGQAAGPAELGAIADQMAAELLRALGGDPSADPALWLTEPLPPAGRLDGVVFSGGVAEYVYGTERRTFGDLGPRLGAALAAAGEQGRLPAPVRPARARIRATVLGASQYSVQLSGITSYLSAPGRTLPRRNLAVAQPRYELGDVVDAAAVGALIARHVARFDGDAGPGDGAGDGAGDLVLALHWAGPPEYPRLRALAEAVAAGLGARIAAGAPLYVMLDGDVARTLGTLLREELGVGNDLVVIDGVLLRDFDYVDLGSVRQPSGTVPVTIKSLVFGH
ncbi:MAG TPA: ethanolamine ammonia-lyase reactivating factor EutA [Trebonia sp.]|jgi:ethanolamine utilization protein EutA|nr:ethanolamine ammonia-lyase reactivating factor EutA [Trebonia sp.]